MSELDESFQFSEQKGPAAWGWKRLCPRRRRASGAGFYFGTVLESWGTQRTQRRQLSSTVGSGYPVPELLGLKGIILLRYLLRLPCCRRISTRTRVAMVALYWLPPRLGGLPSYRGKIESCRLVRTAEQHPLLQMAEYLNRP